MRVEFEDRMGNLHVKVTADVEPSDVVITKFVDVESHLRLPWKDAAALSPDDVQRIEKHAREAADARSGMEGAAR